MVIRRGVVGTDFTKRRVLVDATGVKRARQSQGAWDEDVGREADGRMARNEGRG